MEAAALAPKTPGAFEIIVLVVLILGSEEAVVTQSFTSAKLENPASEKTVCEGIIPHSERARDKQSFVSIALGYMFQG